MSFKADIDDGFMKAIDAVNARRDYLPKDPVVVARFNWHMWSARKRLDYRDYQQVYNQLNDAAALLPDEKEFSVLLYIDADDLSDETVDRIYEAGFDDATIARSGGKTKVMIDPREGYSWIDVALEATKQLNDAGFQVIGMEWDREAS